MTSITIICMHTAGLRTVIRNAVHRAFAFAAFSFVIVATTGCASDGSVRAGSGDADMMTAPREHRIIAWKTLDPISWDELMTTVLEHDIIVLGERHDDMAGHRVQRALVEDLCAAVPGAIVAFEMLERDEQMHVDDWTDGLIDDEAFTTAVNSGPGGSWGAWDEGYLPIMQAARGADGNIVAANAPRRYTRLARTRGFDVLRELSGSRADLVTVPADAIPAESNSYRDRFERIMSNGTPESIARFFRAQLTWDETMARSVIDARETFGTPAVLLIGAFHAEYEGGTIRAMRRMDPDARILVITLDPDPDGGDDISAADDDDDSGETPEPLIIPEPRADIVIETD